MLSFFIYAIENFWLKNPPLSGGSTLLRKLHIKKRATTTPNHEKWFADHPIIYISTNETKGQLLRFFYSRINIEKKPCFEPGFFQETLKNIFLWNKELWKTKFKSKELWKLNSRTLTEPWKSKIKKFSQNLENRI